MFLSRRAVSGIPWTIVNNAILSVLFVGTSAILFRYLGREKFGEMTLCRSIGEFLLLACSLGLNIAALRFVPELVVKKSRTGLIRFLAQTAGLETIAGVVVCAGLIASTPYLEKRFDTDLGWLMFYTSLFILARLFKQFVDDVMTALFEVRSMSIVSIAQGVFRALLIIVCLYFVPEVYMALLTHVASIVPLSLLLLVLMMRKVKALENDPAAEGISTKRLVNISAPRFVNNFIVTLMGKYTEIFFLGIYFTEDVVGIYDLAYTLPLMAITTIPLAMQKLSYSAFAEAYAKDASSLPELISSFYKMLIVLVLPITVFGVVFSHEAFTLMYPGIGAEAGTIGAWLTVFHALTLISIPIGAAMVTIEKLYLTTPIMFVQIAINLLLDWLLIPRYGLFGAVAAVYVTYFITIPVRVYIVRRIIHGVQFQIAFLLRTLVPLVVIGLVMRPLGPYLNLVTLTLLGFAYFALYAGAIRVFRLVRPEDVAGFRSLEFKRLNRAIDWFVVG